MTPDIGHRNGLLADECTQQTFRWVTTDMPRHVIKIVAEKIMLFRPRSEVTSIRRHLIELVATLTNLRREGCTANSVHKSTLALQQCGGCQSSPRQNSCHANLPTKRRGDRRYSSKRKWLLRRLGLFSPGSDDFDQVTTDFRRHLIAMVATYTNPRSNPLVTTSRLTNLPDLRSTHFDEVTLDIGRHLIKQVAT